MPFLITSGDIARMRVDAVVNAANTHLQMGGGVCGAIFAAAGERELQRACDEIGGCDTGDAVATAGFGLAARYILHAVGPIWRGGGAGEPALLASCYRRSLELALEKGCESVAFPLISSGIYGYPPGEALRVATDAIGRFLLEHDLVVYLVIYDRNAFPASRERLGSIQSYLRDRLVTAPQWEKRRRGAALQPLREEAEETLAAELEPPAAAGTTPEGPQTVFAPAAPPAARRLEDLVNQLDEGFSGMLLRLIDEKGRTDVEIYKRANVDRKLFSKIRGNPAYRPSKSTAIAFAIALELSLDETRDLLSRAGFALSRSSRFDVIIEYFIENGIYSLYDINEALFAFDEMLLGA